MSKLEILAPAGGPESILPAVRCGADAVYLGAGSFSARGSAQNFNREQLREAVAFCHGRGVKVYLALNTLLRDEEWPSALALAEEACALPVDALIVQDLGFAQAVRRAAPEMKCSASTQMSVHTPPGAALCGRLGFGRVVLSRELSARELSEIRKAAELELEVFVHGALCMCVSGQCYFSSVLGARSGNRGWCAQPCRLPFTAPGGTGHDLSLKDLSLVGRLGELASLGIDSAKIEGRMKRPEYVAAAVAACRTDADGGDVPAWLAGDLGAVFSRSGFTQGYYTGLLGREMFGTRRREDAAEAPAAWKRLHALYRTERQNAPVRLRFSARKGAPSVLELEDEQGTRVSVAGPPAQECGESGPFRRRCEEQLAKLGGTPFFAREVICEVDEGLSMAVAQLNQLRRTAAEQLLLRRSQRKPVPFDRLAADPGRRARRPVAPMALRLHFSSPEQIPDDCPAAERVYLRADTPPETLGRLLERGLPVAVELPRALFGCAEAFRERLRTARKLGIRDVWAGTLDGVALAQEEGMDVHGGFSLNVFNTGSLQAMEDLGLKDTEVSFELTLTQAAGLGGALPRGMLAYGRLPLMLTRNCPLRNGRDCGHCDKEGALTDRRGISFPVRCFGGGSEVLNSVPLFLLDRLREVRGMDYISMRFTVENSVEIGEILNRFPHYSRPESEFTRGLAEKGVR